MTVNNQPWDRLTQDPSQIIVTFSDERTLSAIGAVCHAWQNSPALKTAIAATKEKRIEREYSPGTVALLRSCKISMAKMPEISFDQAYGLTLVAPTPANQVKVMSSPFMRWKAPEYRECVKQQFQCSVSDQTGFFAGPPSIWIHVQSRPNTSNHPSAPNGFVERVVVSGPDHPDGTPKILGKGPTSAIGQQLTIEELRVVLTGTHATLKIAEEHKH